MNNDLHIKLSKRQMEFLRELAESEKLSIAEIVRSAILLLENQLPQTSHYQPFSSQCCPVIANIHNAPNKCVDSQKN